MPISTSPLRVKTTPKTKNNPRLKPLAASPAGDCPAKIKKKSFDGYSEFHAGAPERQIAAQSMTPIVSMIPITESAIPIKSFFILTLLNRTINLIIIRIGEKVKFDLKIMKKNARTESNN